MMNGADASVSCIFVVPEDAGPPPPRIRPLLSVLRLVGLAAVDHCKGSRPIPDARPYRILAPPDQVLTGRQVFEREEAIPIADGLPVDGARQGDACGCNGAELMRQRNPGSNPSHRQSTRS